MATNDIWMLGVLKDFNLYPLLQDLNWFHAAFLNVFDCKFLPCLLVLHQFDKSKLAFTNILYDAI